ncbi:MAG: GNAT family N-acetyltransferase [Candidatus Delongbacteria bacterium]|nr:GNAT family N-acetyltransferase [Candidatus Delongbacteria bacterium]
MFRKLNTNDKDKLFEFLEKEKAYNLFILGDVENFGFETDMQELWAEFNGDEYIAVLLRYKNFIIISSYGEFSVNIFIDKIKSFDGVQGISGKEWIVDLLAPHFEYKKIRKQYLAQLSDINDIPKELLNDEVTLAVAEDAEEIFELGESIVEFSDFKSSVENVKYRIIDKTSRTYYVRENGRIVASASSTAEISTAAMVVGVCTNPDFRGKGYASKCTGRLSYELLKEGKQPCLFYDNPSAGKIYKKIGYKEIGKWDLIVL